VNSDATASNHHTVQVTSAAGSLCGRSIDTPNGRVDRFAGIPYGQAPTGEHRFRAPRPAQRWQGTLGATDFGPAPAQAVGGPFSGAVPGMAVERIDEDCLTLNIWRPAAAASDTALPVMVWVYGGAFVIGSGSLATYDAARLAAEQQVVVVTINYRVGPFGFLDLRAVPGGETADTNCGLRDQLLALRWVHEHIADFGGDATRLTVFGESAGAGSILHLLTTPGIGGVVRRAIAQSPGIDFTQTASLSQRVAAAVLTHTGARTVDDLRRLSTQTLIDAQQAVSAELLFDLGTMVFHPVVDDQLVPASPSVAIAAGGAADVDLLIGYTTDELRLFPDPRADGLDDAGLTRWTRDYLASRLGVNADEAEGASLESSAAQLVAHYRRTPSSTSRSKGSDVWAAIQTDGTMRQPVIRLADSRQTVGQAGRRNTFVYQFGWQARRPDDDPGAFHAIDLPFTFDSFDVDGWGQFVGIDDTGRWIGRQIRDAWARFAATGDPSAADIPWPAWNSTERSTMVFGGSDIGGGPAEQCGVVGDPLGTQREWWRGLWQPTCRPPGVAR